MYTKVLAPVTLYSAAAAGASSHIAFTAFAIAAILGPTMVSTTCPPCETSGADTVWMWQGGMMAGAGMAAMADLVKHERGA